MLFGRQQAARRALSKTLRSLEVQPSGLVQTSKSEVDALASRSAQLSGSWFNPRASKVTSFSFPTPRPALRGYQPFSSASPGGKGGTTRGTARRDASAPSSSSAGKRASEASGSAIRGTSSTSNTVTAKPPPPEVDAKQLWEIHHSRGSLRGPKNRKQDEEALSRPQQQAEHGEAAAVSPAGGREGLAESAAHAKWANLAEISNWGEPVAEGEAEALPLRESSAAASFLPSSATAASAQKAAAEEAVLNASEGLGKGAPSIPTITKLTDRAAGTSQPSSDEASGGTARPGRLKIEKQEDPGTSASRAGEGWQHAEEAAAPPSATVRDSTGASSRNLPSRGFPGPALFRGRNLAEASTPERLQGVGGAGKEVLPPAIAQATAAIAGSQWDDGAAGLEVVGWRGGEFGEKGRRPVVPWVVERLQRKRFMELNTKIARKFDALEARLHSVSMDLDDRVDLVNDGVEYLRRAMTYPMDVVNVATCMHRLSRVVAHSSLAGARERLEYHDVMQSLVNTFDGIMDAQLQREFSSDGVKEKGASAHYHAECRSLATAMWACGNISYPLTPQQLDKMAGVVMAQYHHLSAHHLSMIVLCLYSYSGLHQPFEGRLAKVVTERAAQLPHGDFEPRTLLNILCTVAAMNFEISKAALENFTMIALCLLPKMAPTQLGGLMWALAKLAAFEDVNDVPLLETLLPAVVLQSFQHLEDFPATSLCNIIYGCGALRYNPGIEFLNATAVRANQLLDGFTAQHMSNLLWAWTRLEYTPDNAPDQRDLPTFYFLSPGDSANDDVYVDGRGLMWRDEGGNLTLATPPPRVRRKKRQKEPQRLPELAMTVHRVPMREGSTPIQPKLKSLGDGLGSSSSVLAYRIAEARAKREAHEALRAMVETEVAKARAAAAAIQQSPRAQAALAAGAPAQPSPPRGRHRAKLRPQVRPSSASRESAEAGAPQPRTVDESDLPSLVGAILYGPQSGKSISRRPRLKFGSLPGSYFEGVLDDRGGVSVHTVYDPEVIRETLRETEDACVKTAASMFGRPVPAARMSRFPGSFEYYFPNLSDTSSKHGSWQKFVPRESRSLTSEEMVDAILRGVQIPSAPMAVLPDDASLPDQIAEVEGSQLACDTGEEGMGGGGAEELVGLEGKGRRIGVPEAALKLPAEAAAAGLTRAVAPTTAASVARRPMAAEEERGELEQQEADHAESSAPEVRRLDWTQDISGMSPAELKKHMLGLKRSFTIPHELLDKWEDGQRVTLDQMAETFLSRIDQLSHQEMSTMMWSFATQRHAHPGLMNAVLERVKKGLPKMQLHILSIIAWSCGVLRHRIPPPLLKSMLDRVMQLMEVQGLNLQGLCNMAWVMAVFDNLDEESFAALLRFLPDDPAVLSRVTTPAWCQIFQCALHLEAKERKPYASYLPPHILPLAEAAWKNRPSTTSMYQEDVQAVLRHMGVPFKIEYSPPNNFFAIDIAVKGADGTKLAIEVDGPHHFYANPPYRPLASTDLRNRLLARHGWRVVSIPCDHWKSMVSLPEKMHYLHQHVLKHVRTYAEFED